MKELNIPALIPQSEVNRTAFVKSFNRKDGWGLMKPLLPHLGKLEDLGLVPQTVAIKRTGKEVHVIMERVNGFELASFPEEYEDFKFSVDLAKKAANLFQGFFEAGYYHTDPHALNIMYDQVKGRCVAVDLESIDVKSNDTLLKKYVQDYSELMLDVYLGEPPLDVLDDLLFKGELQQYMPEAWEEFIVKAEGCKRKNQNGVVYFVETGYLLRAYSYQSILKLMQEKGIESNVHPTVRDFVLCGLNPVTCPESFDEILRLDS